MLIIQERVEDHPGIQKPLSAMLRSFKHSPKTAAGFAKNWNHHHIFTPAGLYLGLRPTYKANRKRLNRVVEKTIRGLYYKESDAVLPPDWYVKILDGEEIDNLPPASQVEFNRIIGIIMEEPQRVIAGGIFRYGFVRPDDGPRTLWFLLFFNRVPFFCITHSRNEFTKRGLPIPG